jgi:hypothetical protein
MRRRGNSSFPRLRRSNRIWNFRRRAPPPLPLPARGRDTRASPSPRCLSALAIVRRALPSRRGEKSGGGRGRRAFLSKFCGAVSRARPVCFPPSRPSWDRAGRYVRLPGGFSASPAHSRLRKRLDLSGAPSPSGTASLRQRPPPLRLIPGAHQVPSQQWTQYRRVGEGVDCIFDFSFWRAWCGPTATVVSPHRGSGRAARANYSSEPNIAAACSGV